MKAKKEHSKCAKLKLNYNEKRKQLANDDKCEFVAPKTRILFIWTFNFELHFEFEFAIAATKQLAIVAAEL